jgi:hypothetical protein
VVAARCRNPESQQMDHDRATSGKADADAPSHPVTGLPAAGILTFASRRGIMTRPPFVSRGLLAGFLAGTTVALWFLIVDLLAAFPLRTPAFLARILFGMEDMDIGALTIGAYTLLHYAVFATLGMVLARLTARVHPRAHLLLGLVVGFFLFDILFYGSLISSGINVIEALGWPVVLFGNLLAGVVLLEYLRLSGPVSGPGWRALLREHRVLREGLVAGLLGASAVALSFLIVDLIFRQALFTPAALGSALFHGAGDPAEIRIDMATVLSYTALHLTAFLGMGLAAAALVAQAEEQPALLLGIALVFVTFEAAFIGAVAIVAVWILGTIGWWNILLGNLIATLAMVGYLARAHPGLWQLLRKDTLAAPR